MRDLFLKTAALGLVFTALIFAGPGGGKGMTYALAFSHDGNSYDTDDIGAVAFALAIADAFGRSSAVVHMDFNDNIGVPGSNGPKMQASVDGSITHLHTPANKCFNDLTQLSAAVANFKAEADKLDATHQMLYMCAGPMEVPYQCLNAAALDKRKYITCISHSQWNDNFKNGTSAHTWANLQSIPGGIVFDHITDQNPNLGSGSNWSALSNMGADYAWLKTRDQKGGDVSDCGMTWYAMTGNAKGQPTDLIKQFAARGTTGLFSQKSSSKGILNLIADKNSLRIQVSVAEAVMGYQISDFSGHIFNSGKMQDNSGWIEVPTNGLSTGKYLYTLTNSDGSILSAKSFLINK